MSDGNTSIDPTLPPSKSIFTPKADASVAELIISARQAIEQKRLKQCMALIKAILATDSANKEALALRSWIRSYLEQDLAKVRVLVEQARTKGPRRLYARADITLRAILDVDPEHEEANRLLSTVRSLQNAPPSQAEPQGARVQVPFRVLPRDPVRPRKRIVPAVMLLLVLGVAGTLWFSGFNPQFTQKSSVMPEGEGVKAPATPVERDVVKSDVGSLALVVLPLVGVQMSLNDGPPGPVPESLDLKAGSYQLRFTAKGYVPETVSQTVVGGERRTVALVLKAVARAGTPAPAAGTPAVTPRVAPAVAPSNALNGRPPVAPVGAPVAQTTKPVPAPTTPQIPIGATTGTLTLNGLISVGVFLKDEYLGSTPVTIKLPAGLQTLEFRYLDLRKTVSYVVKSNETTAATVSFEVTVRINADPWAEVFIDANPQKPLGQTPLSGVALPAGSILVFKNPGFPEKKYQVNGKESSIHIAFP